MEIPVESVLGRGPDWREFGENPLPILLQSAVSTFVENGYHGTSTRTLAAAADLSVPGLYHHFASKQAIIVAIMEYAMNDLWWRSIAAKAEAGANPERQLSLHIECLVLFHAYRANLAFLAATEIRSLEPEARTRHIAARDRQENLLRGIVRTGAEAGIFVAPDPAQVARAMTTMCTGVSQWFKPAGPLSAASVAHDYVRYSQRLVERSGSSHQDRLS